MGCSSNPGGGCDKLPSAEDLGVNWPGDWEYDNNGYCVNDYWYCFPNEEGTGYVYCEHHDENNEFFIVMYQSDDPNIEGARGMLTCQPRSANSTKVCQALGGKLLNGVSDWGPVYQL